MAYDRKKHTRDSRKAEAQKVSEYLLRDGRVIVTLVQYYEYLAAVGVWFLCHLQGREPRSGGNPKPHYGVRQGCSSAKSISSLCVNDQSGTSTDSACRNKLRVVRPTQDGWQLGDTISQPPRV